MEQHKEDDEYNQKQQQKIYDAINLLPSLAYGINVNLKFRRIDDFESTPELAIFALLRIPLFHGWIVNPKDLETATAIGCKSYNALMSALVALETQTVKSPRCQSSRECTATPGIPSPRRSFADSLPASAVHNGLIEEDIEEELALLLALHLSMTKTSRALDHDQLSSTESRDETVCNVETKSSTNMTAVHVTSSEAIYVEKSKLESSKIKSSSKITLKCEGDECGSLGSPLYEGESLLEESSLEGRDTNELTRGEGVLINKFLSNTRSQLTITGLSYLQEQIKEDELCVFFRNNHFLTMKKYNGELYQLVTDLGYLKQQDLVWEKLNMVNGDSVFMTGDFKIFKSDEGTSPKWDQKHAISNNADYMFNVNNSSQGGMDIE
ncbi:hypothetical protein AALP_AA3G221700 [Arabis alpina]|uniref:MINDY deubiquitinase domain-containing protein n=1 Tax=Arabis alpina TaxID=50452 RepID=A0A087HAW2_ARAAL|nr:hypothetical protein AALP_AA3G221700 [Arabis alpina]